MDKIRKMVSTDMPIVALYWAFSGDVRDMQQMYPPDTSYIFERNGRPLYAVALHHIEALGKALVEGFVRDPCAKPDMEAVMALQAHLDAEAKAKGIHTLFALTKDAAVHEHHKHIGYTNTTVMLYTSIRRL
jgi:N-acetylglutamate synthase-like GNAT family acetyltransferase